MRMLCYTGITQDSARTAGVDVRNKPRAVTQRENLQENKRKAVGEEGRLMPIAGGGGDLTSLGSGELVVALK
jgi:hypothetical protein